MKALALFFLTGIQMLSAQAQDQSPRVLAVNPQKLRYLGSGVEDSVTHEALGLVCLDEHCNSVRMIYLFPQADDRSKQENSALLFGYPIKVIADDRAPTHQEFKSMQAELKKKFRKEQGDWSLGLYLFGGFSAGTKISSLYTADGFNWSSHLKQVSHKEFEIMIDSQNFRRADGKVIYDFDLNVHRNYWSDFGFKD